MYPSPTSSSSSSSTTLHLVTPSSTTYPSTITLAAPSSSSSLPSATRRPHTSKPQLPPATQARSGRLGPKCLPGGRLEKYNQPTSAVIPYPRGEVNLMECIEHRRGIRALGKMEGYRNLEESVGQQVIIVRHKTVGGTCKRVWEKVAFWDRAKGSNEGAEADGRDYGFDEVDDEWE